MAGGRFSAAFSHQHHAPFSSPPFRRSSLASSSTPMSSRFLNLFSAFSFPAQSAQPGQVLVSPLPNGPGERFHGCISMIDWRSLMFLRPARQLRSTFPRLFVFADDEAQEALRGAATQFRNDGEFVGSSSSIPRASIFAASLFSLILIYYAQYFPLSNFLSIRTFNTVVSNHLPLSRRSSRQSEFPPINKHHVSLVTRCFCSTSVAHRALASHTSGWIRLLIYNSSPSIHSITSRGSNGHNCLQ
jgi:hypothetical protein